MEGDLATALLERDISQCNGNFEVRGSRYKAGCKLAVRDVDYDTTMDTEFWPQGTRTRPWESRPKNDSNDKDDDSFSE